VRQELEETKKELRAIEARFEAVYNHHYQLTGLMDTEGRLLLANRAALEYAGVEEKDVVGELFWKTAWWSHSQDAQQAVKAAFERALGGVSVRFESTHVSALGETREFEVRISPVVDDNGAVVYLVPEGYDITDRKRAEQEREKLEAQLRQSQKMEAVGQLAGGVAHDFNNLLQAILGYGELAFLEARLGSTLRENLYTVLNAANRAKALVRQLLAFSRRQVLRLDHFDLNEVIEELALMIRRVIGEHIAIDILPEPGPKMVQADRGQIEQILMNLCVNARDAMDDGGTLTVRTEPATLDEDFCRSNTWARPGHFVTLCVSDTGAGMDAETQRRIFEPFYTTKEKDKGTGLGLSTVYGIVNQHDGMIQVHSEVGVGTTFQIYLPASESLPETRPASVTTPAPRGTEVILLAEDNDGVRKLARQYLEDAGYRILLASDGEEAIQLYDRHAEDVDLAFLDIVMPGCGGRSVADHIREAGRHTPVLFTSGYSEGTVHTNFILDEGVELLPKPYSRNELLMTVRRALDRASAE